MKGKNVLWLLIGCLLVSCLGNTPLLAKETEAKVIATSSKDIKEFGVDNCCIYYIEGDYGAENTLKKVNKEGGTAEELLGKIGPLPSRLFSLSDNFVYFFTASDEKLYKYNKQTGEVNSARGSPHWIEMIADPNSAAGVYVEGTSSLGVVHVPAGNEPKARVEYEEIADSSQGKMNFLQGGLAQDADYLYFYRSKTKEILKIAKSARKGTPQKIVDGQDNVTHIAIDDSYVYFIDSVEGRPLKRISKNGRGTKTLANLKGKTVAVMLVDQKGIYLLILASTSPVLYLPKEGGKLSPLQGVQGKEFFMAGNMAIDDDYIYLSGTVVSFSSAGSAKKTKSIIKRISK